MKVHGRRTPQHNIAWMTKLADVQPELAPFPSVTQLPPNRSLIGIVYFKVACLSDTVP